jgi:hypothetical protein
MKELIQTLSNGTDVAVEDLVRLRRGLLMIEREKTRPQGMRLLERMVERRHPSLSPVALAGLASANFWGNDLKTSLYWARLSVADYPMSASAVWCASLTVSMFRMLGMRRERFEAERERFRLMRKIAFQSDSRDDRIYALGELLKELESRDLSEDAKRCAEELDDLINARRADQEGLLTRDISSTR